MAGAMAGDETPGGAGAAHDRDERRRKILLVNALYALLGYFIPIAAAWGGRAFGLASYDLVRVLHLLVGAIGSTLVFCALIAARRRITRAFANGVYLAQFGVWIALFTYSVTFLNEIRVAALFFAFIALVFLLSNGRFATSLAVTLAAVASYAGASYWGIHHLGQQGSMREEVFYELIFLPVALFIAGVSERFHRQRSEVVEARREAEGARVRLEASHREVEEKNASLLTISSKLAKYLSPQVYDSIFSGARDVKRESHRKQLTVFFSDIKGFTELTDSMEPESLSLILNGYLNEMTGVALRHGGTIDKFIGDAVMIFFGDPESRGEREDALACVRMALEMRGRIHDLQKGWLERGIADPLQVRMGISTGYCTVGNFGSDARLEYTIIGGHVNLASRLESKAEPDTILICNATYNLVKDHVQCLPKGEIAVKGIAYPVMTYEAVATIDELAGSEQRLAEEFDGFAVEVDLGRLSVEERGRAVAALERITERVRSAGADGTEHAGSTQRAPAARSGPLTLG